ncbi:MAG: hypothetical protein U9Q38_02490 [Thermodesulfobacteriota bacterium]|nr:hypothetical protein [Thermodesulfobacteriota bacterium]
MSKSKKDAFEERCYTDICLKEKKEKKEKKTKVKAPKVKEGSKRDNFEKKIKQTLKGKK